MDRTDCCILVNSTPAYYYILPLFFKLLRRYAPKLRWDVILATEVPDNSICRRMASEYAVKVLPIPESASGFLESRYTALKKLSEDYRYCLPLQDDFLLEMPMDGDTLTKLIDYMETSMSIVSARLMPCPGPNEESPYARVQTFKMLDKKTDPFGFTFQATLWKMKPLCAWYGQLCNKLEELCPKALKQPATRRQIELRENLAENALGQELFWEWSDEKDYEHLAFERAGPWPNAVYLSPFPYRPTAIVRGKLEDWARDLAKREGSSL